VLCYDVGVRQLGIAAQVLTIAVVAAACRAGAFACEQDADCAGGGAAGICEAAGACSFADDDCASGRRYGDHSPDDLASECVEPPGTSPTSDTSGADTTSLADTSTSLEVTSSDAESTSAATIPTSESGESCPSDWWDCAWSRRVALDLPATATDTFTEVPVLVVLGSPRIELDDVSAGGADLRFVDADGDRVPHEIERWDPSGASIVWISVPTLGPRSGPRLWLYYGNASAVDDQDADAVWSDVHAAVWHLSRGAIDASGYGHDGVQTRGVADSAGQLAGAKELFDVDDRIDVPPSDVLDDACFGGATLSAWVRPDTFGGTSRGRIADKTAGGPGGWMFYLSSDGGGEVSWRHGYEDEQVIWRAAGEPIQLDTWHHVAVTFDALELDPPRMYVDGVEQEVDHASGAMAGPAVSDVGLDVVIGNSDVANRWFDGVLDEIRIERTIRGPAWIELQHRSMTDMLVVYSPPERLEDAR
jgi:hypothetical protein